MKSADLVITADYVLPMDESLSVIEKGAIAISGRKIVAAGPEAEISAQYTAAETLDGRGMAAFPGLINTHTHAAMVYFRGLADDLPLATWLERHIWPAESKWLSPEFVNDAAELACAEMIRAGVTAYADMYFFGDAVAEATRKIGMRAVIGAGVVDFPTVTGRNADDYLSNAERFINRWKGDNLIVPSIADHSAYSCCPETLRKSKTLSDRLDALLQIHLSETQWEVREILSRYGRRPVSHLESLGLLDERLIAVHCVWLDPDEIGMLAASKTGVSHCLESNLKLASGIAPVPKMLQAGVKVTFGTDGAASNNDLSILSEMSTAAKLHKAVSGDPTVLSAKQAMLMATRWAAGAIGIGDTAGSIEPGKAADIVLADLRRPHLVPIYDIYSHIVYSMNASDIDTVLVNGRLLMQNRRLLTADEPAIMTKAADWAKKIVQGSPNS